MVVTVAAVDQRWLRREGSAWAPTNSQRGIVRRCCWRPRLATAIGQLQHCGWALPSAKHWASTEGEARARQRRARQESQRVVLSPDRRPVPGAVRRHHRLPLLFVPVTIGLAFLWPLCRASGTVRETHRCAI